jgi:putative transposase
MARPLCLESSGAVSHLTSRGNARQPIVDDDRDRSHFLSLLAHVVDRYGWHCHAYCVMDNHYHLLVGTPQPTLSDRLQIFSGRQFLLSWMIFQMAKEYASPDACPLRDQRLR